MKHGLESMETAAMVQIDCPWCAGPAVVTFAGGDAREAVDCADCGVRVELAADPVVIELARAA